MTKKKSFKKTTPKSNYFQILVIVLVAMLIVFGLLIWRNKYKDIYMMKDASQEEINTSQNNNYPLDTENDGVYTDYKYGFSFKYPKEVFVDYEAFKNPNSDTSEAVFSDRVQAIADFQMRVSARVQDSSEIESINKYRNMRNNVFEYTSEEIKKLREQNLAPYNINQKVKNLDSNFYKGVLLYSKYICETCETEPSNGHSARFILNNGNTVNINISSYANLDATFSDSVKDQRLKILNNIIQSLEIVPTSHM